MAMSNGIELFMLILPNVSDRNAIGYAASSLNNNDRIRTHAHMHMPKRAQLRHVRARRTYVRIL